MSPVRVSAVLRFAAAHLGTAAREQAVVARERSVRTPDCRGPAVGACVADTGYRHDTCVVMEAKAGGQPQGLGQLWTHWQLAPKATVGPLTVHVYFCALRVLLQGIRCTQGSADEGWVCTIRTQVLRQSSWPHHIRVIGIGQGSLA